LLNMAKRTFQSLTGMRDIWGEGQKYFQRVYDVVKENADFYGFQKIETPILEPAKLFLKGLGLSTDVVQKQMFVFKTKGKDEVALRPEGTASIVRSYIEQGMYSLPQPVKLWYWGPFFRYERPQLGRFRQFYQFGFEILGREMSIIDVQIIKICYNILEELELKDLLLEINSIGCLNCRPVYRKVLVSFLRSKKSGLCGDCKKRLKENPLRILDCKVQKCQEIIAPAPQSIDYLCEECHDHFKEVLEFLDELELPYFLKTHLVRGLDYYTKTVFEITGKSKEGEKIGALLGGGRYDRLVKLLGGKQTPACGVAGGVERIIALMKNQNVKIKEPVGK
ncbi:MAG: histidine--tRNA ligase, partial [Ignavibacteria bacterium]|nr:histidine--tRNA ligase [Ignavibacteria bacterium]